MPPTKAFQIRDPELPHSIYEIEGAKRMWPSSSVLFENGRLHGHPMRAHGGANRGFEWGWAPDGQEVEL